MMRKNSKFYLGILLVSGMLGLSSPARSQLVGGVSFDFGGDAAAAITPVFEQIQTAADEAVKYAKEKVTKLKASIGSYFTKRKNAAEKVPGTKQFAEETSVDIYDPAAVQTAINELFLQYPSSDQRVNRFYEKEAAEFYYDTMIEIQTASKKLEAQLNSLRTEIDNFSKDAIAPSGGNAGSMSSSDENGNYYNLYLAHKKFNDVLKVTEEVMALYSQYYVARAIYRKTILPAPYQEESAEGEGKKSAASRYFSSKMAFAQFVSGSTASAAAEEEEAEDTETKWSSYTEVNFAVPEAPEAKSLMAGSEKELADLGVISDAQKSLNEALKAHNTIRLLPTYRNIFRQYELFKQMHEKAAQAVASSDQCVVQYLGRRYDQPEKVWYGTMAAPADPTDYDSRTGRDLIRTLLPLWIWARKQTAATLPALRASAKRRRRWILPVRWPIRARKKNFPPQPARWNWLPGRSAPRRRKFWPKTSIPTVRFTARQLILTRCGRIRRAFTISISTANMKI